MSKFHILSTKLRKISVFKHKNGSIDTFFQQKSHFFPVFVCFFNTLPYICVRILLKLFLSFTFAAGAGLTKVDAKKALDATVAAIIDALKKGDKVQLVGFGTFAVTEKPAREGINPATKEKITIAAKKVAKFKAGAELADAVK